MSERLKIGKQLEKSMTPWSVLITLDNNEGAYLPPGDNGQILTLNNGLINWADPALEINGTPGYLARFDGLGTNIEDSKIFDNTPNAGSTDIKIFDNNDIGTYLEIVVRDDSSSFLSFFDTPAVAYYAGLNGVWYQSDVFTPTERTLKQKGGVHFYRDTNNLHLANLANTQQLGFTVASAPTAYVSARFISTSNCAGLANPDAFLNNPGINNYIGRSQGLINSFGDIMISNHTLPDYEDTEGSDFLRFASFSTSFVNSTTTPFAFVVGQSYKIVNYVIGDDFTNIADVQVGVINADNCIFIATGTTPTTWTNGTEIGNTFAEIDNNQFIINNTGTSATFNTEVSDGSITSYDFQFEDVTEFEIFQGQGVATLAGSIWDLGAAAAIGGAPPAADTYITVTINGTSYSILAVA